VAETAAGEKAAGEKAAAKKAAAKKAPGGRGQGSQGALMGGLVSLVSLTARCSEGGGGRRAVLTVHRMAASGDALEASALASALASSGATIVLLVKQVLEGSSEEHTAAARILRILCAHEVSPSGIVAVLELAKSSCVGASLMTSDWPWIGPLMTSDCLLLELAMSSCVEGC